MTGRQFFLTVLMSLTAAACGGGGSSSSSSENDTDTPPSVDAGADQTVGADVIVSLSAAVNDDGSVTITWVQDQGPSVSLSDASDSSPFFTSPSVASVETLSFTVTADDGVNAPVTDSVTITVDPGLQLSNAFLWFGPNVSIAMDGSEVVIEANGRPDHTSAYWNPNNASGLYVEPDPTITTASRMSPGYIEEYDNLFTLRVPVSPQLAATSSATSLGPVGIAVSGAPIFNDQEGPNIELNLGVISGFDRNGAHTGPSTYHYHLEPQAISFDDDALIGVMADGFFLYGRRDWETGEYPTDLDSSGGHVGFTRHTGTNPGDERYHYHVQNELYLGGYYLLFPGDYEGTPNAVSN